MSGIISIVTVILLSLFYKQIKINMNEMLDDIISIGKHILISIVYMIAIIIKLIKYIKNKCHIKK